MVLPVEQLGNISLMWVILAVVFGLLLIALIAIIMYRTGCFKTNVGDDQIDIKQYAGKSYNFWAFNNTILSWITRHFFSRCSTTADNYSEPRLHVKRKKRLLISLYFKNHLNYGSTENVHGKTSLDSVISTRLRQL